MTPRVGKIWLTIALGLCGLSSLATAQRAGAGNLPVYEPCASANLSGAVAVRAPEDRVAGGAAQQEGEVRERGRDGRAAERNAVPRGGHRRGRSGQTQFLHECVECSGGLR